MTLYRVYISLIFRSGDNMDRDEFVKQWSDYANEMIRLKWNLDAKDAEKLDRLRHDLGVLIACAAINQER